MLHGQQEEDFQRFLRRVDDITNLLQDLNSPDPAVKENAIAETEKRLREQEAGKEEESKTTVNRTVINTRASVRAFPFSVKDAKERAKRRKRNERLANALKEKGNDAFRKGDYDTAIQRYTEGLEKLKDKQELYTNRAQAYLKTHEYEKAIGDCEWALKCSEKCIKAYFLMGKAHLALKHYSESRQCYQKILEIDPQKESLFKDCINEVNLEEKRMKEEDRAMKEFLSGKLAALSVKELLQKLDRPDQNILFYAGGIKALTGAVKDCTEQTLFRTNNGFSIINDNEVVRRGFCAERKHIAEVDLSVSLLLLWQAVCAGNEENQRLLLTHPDVNAQLSKLLASGVLEIQKETLALIMLYSENENGRRLLVRHQDLSRWLQILVMFVKNTDARATSTSAKMVNQAALAQCIGIMGNLCADTVIRMQMADCKECWQACIKLVVRRLDGSLQHLLGLMMNLLKCKNSLNKIVCISKLLFFPSHTVLAKRAIGVLSRVLLASSLAVEAVVKEGVVKKMIKFLKVNSQEEVVKSDKRFSVLLKLLDSENEIIVGNAAFCLGQCLVVPGAATSLLNSNVVMTLLKHAGGDATRTSVQENAAIALGKLCVAEPRHIVQLRELNGMAILNSSMKYVHSI
uniref:Tetratricopeptide repeat protein 12 n=1 Tax=Anas platyrhynchos TaxID=8839 RepID=A0A8B9TKU7_ANAPL